MNLPTAAGITGKVMFMEKTDGGVNGITVDRQAQRRLMGQLLLRMVRRMPR